MYKEFYLMRKEPFDSHPSPELFYKSKVHQTAWHYLVQGIKQHEPILVLAGEYGAGKTLLFLKLVRLLDKKSRLPIVAVPSPTYTFATVLEKIVEKLLNISTGSIDAVEESTLQQAVYEHFEKAENRSPIYVIIDDAQEFSYSFINKLRLFASYNCDGFFPIRLIFFSHHSFLKMLRYKKLVALGQRIKRIYHLKPLNFEETKEYIYFRLIHSGATGTPVFNDEAIAVIQDVSGGNPRLINNVCDNCLLVAGDERVNLIDLGLVYSVMEKGSLTGLKDVELPPLESAAKKVSGTGLPLQPDFQPIPEAVGVPGYAPSDAYPQPFSHVPPQPPFGQEGYGNPMQPMPNVQPNPAGQMYSNGHHFQNVDNQEEKSRLKRKSIGFLEQYGKIIMIVILALVIVFLSSYLFNQFNADKMLGMKDLPERRIMKQVPAYTLIDPELPIRQYREAVSVQVKGEAQVPDIIGEKNEQKSGAYKPILLTGNLES